MTVTDWTGAIGVALLLLAYFLNLFGKISQHGLTYITLNLIGAGIACLASVLLNYLPFVILEGAWTMVSLVALLKHVMKG